MEAIVEFLIECFNCSEKYNASDAVLCSCLSIDRSFVCPHCINCFCVAPKQYKQLFWEYAPQDLWNRMLKERDEVSSLEANPSPDEVKRPLILIVEPDKQIQRTAKRVIENLGYGVVVASDGQSGITLTENYKPDLVLTAALMPKMDGREMCRLIKESPVERKTRIVVMTSLYTQKKYRSEAFKRFHVDEYLSKPLKMRDLQALLEKYLEVQCGAGQIA